MVDLKELKAKMEVASAMRQAAEEGCASLEAKAKQAKDVIWDDIKKTMFNLLDIAKLYKTNIRIRVGVCIDGELHQALLQGDSTRTLNNACDLYQNYFCFSNGSDTLKMDSPRPDCNEVDDWIEYWNYGTKEALIDSFEDVMDKEINKFAQSCEERMIKAKRFL